MSTHLQTGIDGEEVAMDYLMQKGYQILERNWRAGHKEVDLIATHDCFIVFVEVKTRSGSFLSAPSQTINKQKQRLIIQAANSYVRRYKVDLEVRLDAIYITKNNQDFQIEHIESAFLPYL